jgi:hypothetical protein
MSQHTQEGTIKEWEILLNFKIEKRNCQDLIFESVSINRIRKEISTVRSSMVSISLSILFYKKDKAITANIFIKFNTPTTVLSANIPPLQVCSAFQHPPSLTFNRIAAL